MKKLVILFALAGLLTACSSNQSTKDKADETAKSSSVAKNTSTEATSASETSTSGDAFQELTKAYPDVKMPLNVSFIR